MHPLGQRQLPSPLAAMLHVTEDEHISVVIPIGCCIPHRAGTDSLVCANKVRQNGELL